MPDALIETWQADPARRPGSAASAAARPTRDGRWEIVTRQARPAAGGEAPHIAVAVFARGLLHRVATRIYFADEPEANAADPLLSALDRRAPRDADRRSPTDGGYRFDIHLQGEHETAFFAL